MRTLVLLHAQLERPWENFVSQSSSLLIAAFSGQYTKSPVTFQRFDRYVLSHQLNQCKKILGYETYNQVQ